MNCETIPQLRANNRKRRALGTYNKPESADLSALD